MKQIEPENLQRQRDHQNGVPLSPKVISCESPSPLSPQRLLLSQSSCTSENPPSFANSSTCTWTGRRCNQTWRRYKWLRCNLMQHWPSDVRKRDRGCDMTRSREVAPGEAWQLGARFARVGVWFFTVGAWLDKGKVPSCSSVLQVRARLILKKGVLRFERWWV